MFYIYKITNTVTGKIYVGRGTVRTKTYGPEHDRYFGSGRIIKRSLEKYGKENHTKEILEYCETKEQAIEREPYWIKELDAMNPEIGYNMTLDSSGFTSESAQAVAKAFYDSLTEEQKDLLYKKRAEAMRDQVEKIRQASKDMWAYRSEEENQRVRAKLSASWTPEKREAQRNRLLGSKRKSNLEYMIDKYGEAEGRDAYAKLLKRQAEGSRARAAERGLKLKETYKKCPIYSKMNKEVNQPKSVTTRRLKNKTIAEDEALKLLQEIEERHRILSLELQEWKNTHAINA